MKRFRKDLLCLLLLPAVMATGQWGLGAYICVGADGHVGAKFGSDGKCSVRPEEHCGDETSCLSNEAIRCYADACGACYDIPIGSGVALRDSSPRRLAEQSERAAPDAAIALHTCFKARNACSLNSPAAGSSGIPPHLRDLRTVILLT